MDGHRPLILHDKLNHTRRREGGGGGHPGHLRNNQTNLIQLRVGGGGRFGPTCVHMLPVDRSTVDVAAVDAFAANLLVPVEIEQIGDRVAIEVADGRDGYRRDRAGRRLAVRLGQAEQVEGGLN